CSPRRACGHRCRLPAAPSRGVALYQVVAGELETFLASQQDNERHVPVTWAQLMARAPTSTSKRTLDSRPMDTGWHTRPAMKSSEMKFMSRVSPDPEP